MKLYEFYDRVLETTGLDVMTIPSLRTSIKNCLADLTSRGYKEFKEVNSTNESLLSQTRGMIVIDAPLDIRKSLYLKIAFSSCTLKASRLGLTDPRIAAVYDGQRYKSIVGHNEVIYYVKQDKMYIEWNYDELGPVVNYVFGYYARLTVPYIPDDIITTMEEMGKDFYDINIREEFEDALVFYAAYFFFARYIKDTDKMQFYLNNYKYYVEDIIHELSYEDAFYEEDSVIKIED